MKHPFTKFSNRKKTKTSSAVKAEKPQQRKQLSYGQSIFLLVFAGIGLLGVSGWYWYQNILTNPDRILSDVLDKSLQTTSVSRIVYQENDQSSVEQSLYVSFTPETYSRSVTSLEESSSAGKSEVVTETIGRKNTDFVRYDSIEVSTRGGGQQNFDNIVNVWGIRHNDPESGQAVSFLNDALFVAVPFGNLNASQRAELKGEIRDVNLYETLNTQTEFINGRPVVTYTLNISPQDLVQVLAKYVEITGVGTATDLDPALYEGAPATQVELQVDMLSRHVKEINFPGSGRTESYGAYNGVRHLSLPTDTISVEELQKRLTEIERRQQQQQRQQQPRQQN